MVSELSELIASEIADFFAGFGGPGEPDIQNGEAQRLLTERVLSVLALRERAEPVAYRYRFRPTSEAAGKWILVETIEEANPLPKYEIQPLYTAPPAPVAAGWIACSERLPKIGDEIFYYCEDDGIRDCGIVSSSNFTGRGDAELFVHAEGYDLRFGADITHWMPLPEAPATN
ncbi:DUF551 domain-containing protein [Cronobacter sakazakii]